MPTTTVPSWKRAGEVSVMVRSEQSRLREQIGELSKDEGRARVAAIIRNPQGAAASMRVALLLRAPQRTAEGTARSWLAQALVSGTTRVGEIPPGKRERLARLVES